MFILCGIVSPALNAQSEDDFDVEQLSDGTVSITGYHGRKKDIVIPGTIYGIRVTEIGKSAFGNAGIRSVVIPEGVRKIGESAFDSSDGTNNPVPHGPLASITLPRSLVEIGGAAFCNNSLEKVTLPPNVTSIAGGAFSRNYLTSIRFPAGLKALGKGVVDSDTVTQIILPNLSYIDDIYIGAPYHGIRYLGTLFGGCQNLTEMYMPPNMNDDALAMFGLEEGFVNFYISRKRKTGLYVKKGKLWTYAGQAIPAE